VTVSVEIKSVRKLITAEFVVTVEEQQKTVLEGTARLLKKPP